MELSNRDIAFLFGFGAAGVVLLAWRPGRESAPLAEFLARDILLAQNQRPGFDGRAFGAHGMA
jgi:hypothetical protein